MKRYELRVEWYTDDSQDERPMLENLEKSLHNGFFLGFIPGIDYMIFTEYEENVET